MNKPEPLHHMTAAELGQRLRHARKQTGVTLKELSQRTGFSMRLLSEAERGKLGVSIGRILEIASAVGVELMTRETPNKQINVAAYPQLRLLAWQGTRRFIGERDALALYESNWRFVDHENLDPREAALIEQLVQRHCAGVLNVQTRSSPAHCGPAGQARWRLLRECECGFAGGTAIAMLLNEFRRSADIALLCASTAG